MKQVCSSLARRLRRHGVDARVETALRMWGVREKSVQMAHGSARVNRVGGNIVVRRGTQLEGQVVIVVDDIVTTGSTLRQCVQTLKGAGATVLTALSLSQTVYRA